MPWANKRRPAMQYNAAMLLRFTKADENHLYTLTCTRDDGSVMWQRTSAYFCHHDLIHYAVETTLGMREGFLGLLAAGRDINDFGTRDGEKDNYTEELDWFERIVGLFQWPEVGGGPSLTYEEFQSQLATMPLGPGWRRPEVSVEQFDHIREQSAALHVRWSAIPPGQPLELAF